MKSETIKRLGRGLIRFLFMLGKLILRLLDITFNIILPTLVAIVLGILLFFIGGSAGSGGSGSVFGGISFPSSKSMNDTNRLFRDTLNDHNWTRRRPGKSFFQ